MSQHVNVSLKPADALALIIDGMEGTELLHQELNDTGEGRSIGMIVLQRFFLRSGSQGALVIAADNLKDLNVTDVRLIPAGTSGNMFFRFDYGAGQSFAGAVLKLLEPHIIS